MSTLVALLLAQSVTVNNGMFKDADGGWTLRTTVGSGGGGTSSSVTVTNFPATQPVSGTLTCNAGSGTLDVSGPLTDTQLRATAVPVSGSVNVLNFPGSQVVSGTVSVSNFPATQPVSGTLTCNAGTGTLAVSGPLTDTQLRATAVPVSGTVSVTELQSSDTTNGGAAPTNVLVTSVETATQGTTQPTAVTAGTMRRPTGSTDGAQYVRMGGPVTWQCSLDAIAATLTQCQAAPAAGLRLYVTDISIQSTTATAGLFLLRQGTGTNCGTGTASIFPSAATVVRYGYPANTAAQASTYRFTTPVVLTAANALCVLCTATNTCTVAIQGYTAP